MVLDGGEAEAVLDVLAQRTGLLHKGDLSAAQVAALGVLEVVNAHMERALRVISVERGYDPQDFALVSFGGAGGLHAADLARAMDISEVIVPRGASTLSAFGMIAADLHKDYVQTVMLPGDTPLEELEKRIDALAKRGLEELRGQGVPRNQITLDREIDMRYVGQGFEISVPLDCDFQRTFHDLHRVRYGHSSPNVSVEIVNLRLRAVGSIPKPILPKEKLGSEQSEDALINFRPVVLSVGRICEVPFYAGDDFRPGNRINGPAVIVYSDTTVFLGEGDLARVEEGFGLVINVMREA
jgi:N-methylhydantoinase A